VVIANELLDNLPFGIAQWDGRGWSEIRVGLDGDRFVEVPVPLPATPPVGSVPLPDPGACGLAPGARVPVPRGMVAWFRECEQVLRSGRVLLFDYMTDAPALRLRTYRGHERGTDPLDAPGTRDITADVVTAQVRAAAPTFAWREDVTQREWLHAAGIDALAAEGAAAWRDGAHRGDLAALAGRSRVHEAEVLTDPGGLGAHRVVTLSR